MSDTATANDVASGEGQERFLIGSYVLETLTTGMYVEPRDSVREYVQNAFDAIELARRDKLLTPAAGEIRIVVTDADDGSITITDDGASIPAAQAWDTLTSIGASRKNPRRQAGFRGIGRLGGIAYCRRLEFECKASGETESSTIVYDCEGIKRGLLDGGELESVFRTNISRHSSKATRHSAHYTIVRLLGTNLAPPELTNVSSLYAYLQAVAPVDFREGWAGGTEIREHALESGYPIPTVRLLVGTRESDLEEVRKAYGPMTMAGSKAAPIRRVEYFSGGSFGAARWWGWYGVTSLYGLISEPEVAGIRLRVKNLQLDGTEILARLFARVSTSFDRFAPWFLGEIYLEVGDNSLVPNARRDGFEDSPGWRDVQDQIVQALTPLVGEAYKASRLRSSKDFKQVIEATKREVEDIQTALAGSQVDSEERKKGLGKKIKAALKRVENLNFDHYTDDQQKTLREAAVQLRSLAERAEVHVTRQRPRQPDPIAEQEDSYPDFLDVVFEVLTPILDTRTFNQARKALIERFRES